jgi:hypothetical protein
MTILKRDLTGGTFDSRLTVFPLFTFTRQGDNVQRTLDVGALVLTPEGIEKLILRSKRVSWVYNCPADVLVVTGLNDEFCASATPSRRVLTKEQAKLARHGILPSPQPVASTFTPVAMAPLKKFAPCQNPRITEQTIEFIVLSQGIIGLRVEIYDLAGVNILAQEAIGHSSTSKARATTHRQMEFTYTLCSPRETLYKQHGSRYVNLSSTDNAKYTKLQSQRTCDRLFLNLVRALNDA